MESISAPFDDGQSPKFALPSTPMTPRRVFTPDRYAVAVPALSNIIQIVYK